MSSFALVGAQLASDADHVSVSRFLIHEAELLDENRLDEWLELLAPDVRYFMPVRTSVLRDHSDESASKVIGHFDDGYDGIALRISRLKLPTAWAEDPPSRTRRLITNVRVSVGDADDELRVRSYLLLLRSRWDSPDYEQISAERRDVVRRHEGGFLIASREILCDQVTLGMTNLAVFL